MNQRYSYFYYYKKILSNIYFNFLNRKQYLDRQIKANSDKSNRR